MLINDKVPTSILLDVKIGDEIQDNNFNGTVNNIDVQETDDYLMFLFTLESKQQIVVKKFRQVC